MQNADVHTAQVYPWQQREWSQLSANPARLPHAILLSGAPGMGKNAFARLLANGLLCAQPDGNGYGCGQCKSCRLFAAEGHPDLVRIEPAEEGKVITVNQIRALGDFLALHTHTAARKIVIVSPAESMNIHAANSLLKLLEEPPPASLILLVSARVHLLPATIRSRCHRLEMRPPERGRALQWLAQQAGVRDQDERLLDLAGGAPLRALTLARTGYLDLHQALLADMEALTGEGGDPVACAARWNEQGAEKCLAWLQGYAADLIRLAMLKNPPIRLYEPAVRARLQGLAKRLNLKELFGFLADVAEARKYTSAPLDKLLLIEDVLIRWYRLTRRNRH